jgi:hypothetical protein
LSLGNNSRAIQDFIEGHEKEAKSLIKEVSTLSVWSSTPVDVIWCLPYTDRQIMSDVIKEKMDILYGKNGVARPR